MSYSQFVQYLIIGLSVGGMYALIAIGYTMVYGILRLINFAHGEVFMMGGYFMIFLCSSLNWGWMIAIPGTIVLTALLGFFIESGAYRPLRNAPRMSVMISAIGVSYLIVNLATYLFTAQPKPFPSLGFLNKTVELNIMGDIITTTVLEILRPLISVILLFVLMIIVKRTKFGMAMRAVSKDYDTAELMGIKINRVISLTFIIGSALAGVGSVLYFGKVGAVTPSSGTLPGLKCFVAAVFGGIGSIPGAVIGGFVIGLSETILTAVGLSEFKDAFTFVLLIVILLVKPTGLLGKNEQEKV